MHMLKHIIVIQIYMQTNLILLAFVSFFNSSFAIFYKLL